MASSAEAQLGTAPGLDAPPFAVALHDSPWLLDALQTAHLLGIALFIGTVVAFDLRVLGINKRLSVHILGRHLIPLTLASLALIVPTGLAMFAAHAPELLNNRLFGLKMAMILTGGVNAVIFHTGPYRAVKLWHRGKAAPHSARLCAALSILIWLLVLVCGRALHLE